MAGDTSPTRADEKARSERVEQRLKVATAFLGLLTAIATVLGVTVGLFAKKNTTANQRVDDSQLQVRTVESQNSSLRQRIAELESEAATPDPASAPASPGSVEPTSATIGTAADPPVRHEGDLILVPGSGYDMLSTDPRWGQDTDCSHHVQFGDGDPPQISTDGFCSAHSIKVASLQLGPSDQGNYGQCRTSTGYGMPDTLNTEPGVRHCLHYEEYYALLTVKSVARSRIVIHLKTWELE